MPTSYTSSLGLALPATGELTGTWGDTVNDYITKYVDASVAGTQTISGSQTAVTLSTTTGGTLAQAGAGATGSSQYQIINCTGNPAGMLTITAPATSKTYIVLNATSTNQQVKLVGTGPTTGVTLEAGERAVVAWNGSDFAKVASSATDGVSTISFGTTGLTPSTATSGAVTVAGTLATANGGTGLTTFTAANRAVYSTSASALTAGTLPVAAGGTGTTTLTANNVLLGNGTSAFQVVAPGASGNVLTSNGTTWTSSTPAVALIGTTQSATPFGTYLGFEAGLNSTGTANTFVGFSTGKTITTGQQNTFIGGFIASNASGTGVASNNNVVVGYNSLLGITNSSASQNVIVGNNSGSVLTTGGNNTFVGNAAGNQVSSGSNNVFVGVSAGGINANTGSNLIIIGATAGASVSGASNEITLGNASITTFRIPGLSVSWTSSTVPNVTTNGAQLLSNKSLLNPAINGYTETQTSANAGATATLAIDTATVLNITLTANCTFTFPTPTASKSFLLLLRQDATGNRTVTWPATVRWPGGTAPTLTATASRIDKFVFTSDGTSWFGTNAGQNYTA